MGAASIMARLHWFHCLAACMWLASASFAQSEWDGSFKMSPISEPTIRETARRILSDPAFSGFDHFDSNPKAPRASATPPAAESTDSCAASESAIDTSQSGGTTSNAPRNWWDEIRNNHQKSSRSGDAERGDTAQSSGQARSSTEGTSEGNGRGEASSPPAGDVGGETTPSQSASSREITPVTNEEARSAERPQRAEESPTGTPQRPAQQGSDGVTRPVRYTPKPPPPPSSSTPGGPFWLWELLARLFSGLGGVVGGMFHGIAYAALGLIVLLLVALAARALVELLRRQRTGTDFPGTIGTRLEDERSPGEIAADVYLQRAQELARQGDYHGAVSQLLLGAMSAIERRQWIRYRRGLTLADYLRSVRSQPATHSGLATVVRVFEPIEYGRQPATADGFQIALNGYRQGFGTLS